MAFEWVFSNAGKWRENATFSLIPRYKTLPWLDRVP